MPVLAAERTRTRLVTIGAAAWAGLATLATVQALRGQPLLRPDAVTLTALAGQGTGGAQAGLATLATVQALRGQPLLRPDAVTLTALAGLGAASALAAVVTLRRPPL